MTLLQEREKFNRMVEKTTREYNELNANLLEESNKNTRLQLELDSKESDIEQLRQRLVANDTLSISSGNDLDSHDEITGTSQWFHRFSSPVYKAYLITHKS